MPKSTNTCNKFLALLYNATAWANVADNASSSPLTNIYVGLHTGALTASNDTQTDLESAYTNYARQAKARSSSGWNVPSGGSTSNNGQIQFPQCGVTGSTVSYVSTGSDVSGAGHVFHYGSLNSPLAVANGITPQFATTALQITET